jgi:hypothetical protein
MYSARESPDLPPDELSDQDEAYLLSEAAALLKPLRVTHDDLIDLIP